MDKRLVEVFEEAYLTYREPLINEVYQKTNNYWLAEDCVQETFVALLEKLLEMSNDAGSLNVYSYLRKVNQNLATRMLYREIREFGNDIDVDSMVDTEEPALDIVCKKELYELLSVAIESLYPEIRLAIICKYANGMTYKAIGDLMNKSESATQRAVGRALEALKNALKKEC